MRLMLGESDKPSLLVNVEDNYDPKAFKFWVVNGAWYGTFDNGKLFVTDHYDGQPVSYTTMVLCDNQDRLRGKYEDVFYNFHDVDYVAPQPKIVKFDNMDDDIPF